MPTRALLRYQNREDGFTLIELLIVVLIIGILAAIAIPIYLGIQNNGFKSAVRADVNISVKRVQVALTENAASMAGIKTNQAPYTQRSVKGEVVQILDSTTNGASSSDYLVKGVVSTSTTPAGPINYSYIYDSVSGKFTESDAVVLGSSIPSTTITTSTLPDATKDAAYSATVSASTTNPGGTTVYSATGLPTTLTIDGATGKITGTPTTTGTYSVTVTASNAGVSDSKTYNLNVYATPSIGTTSLPAGDTSATYNQTITASGNPTPVFSLTSGALPDGITLSTGGVLTGKPTATGNFTFTIKASNTAGNDSKTYTVVVNQTASISTTSLPDSKVGSVYSQTVSSTGYPAPTYTATSLPTGLSMNSSSGVISGTPAALSGQSYNITVKADNGIGTAATKNYTLVNNEAPSLYTVNAKSGKVGQTYNYKLVNPGYTLGGTTASGSNLPAGLSVNGSGYLVGTIPTNASQGEYWFDTTFTNSAGSQNAGYNIVVLDANNHTIANSSGYAPYASYAGVALNDQQCGYYQSLADGCYQWVEGGVWFRSPAGHGNGYYMVYNITRRVWAPSGYESGSYGWPTGNPVFNADGTVTQQFEKGSITTSSKGLPGSY